MPLPEPRKGEKEGEFVSRCMGDATALRDFPAQPHRSAVCHKQWEARVQKQAPVKTVDGVGFPAGAFAHVPDPTKPSTWKLRLFDAPADVAAGKPSIRLTAAAAMALSPSGFRGNRVQLPTADVPKVKRVVAAAWIKARTQAGQSVSSADLPRVLKTSPEPERKAATALSLDEKGQEAFARLAGGLKGLADSFSGVAGITSSLAKDMVLVRRSEDGAPAGTPLTIAQAIEDLELILSQVKDDVTKAQFDGVLGALRMFAVPQTPEPPPAQEGQPEIKLKLRILKKEEDPKTEDERTVFGIVLEPEVVDAQKDIYSAEEIRKTAYRFMERYQQFGYMHSKVVPTILPLENYIAPVDFEEGGQKIKKGSWLLRVRVLDDTIWKGVRSGELTGFSIGGTAVRKPEKKPEKPGASEA